MSLTPSRVFLFLISCFTACTTVSWLCEKTFGSEGEICLSSGDDLPCIRFFTLDEIIGYKKFIAEKTEKEVKAIEVAAEKAETEKLVKTMISAEDSINVLISLANRNPSVISLPENNRKFWEEIFKEWELLFERKKLYRILHYGDSQIEMDRITAVVRKGLQKRFGGGGPGLVPPLQLIPTYTISQTASPSWKRFISYGISADRYHNNHYGPLGMVFPFDSGYAHTYISARLKNDSLLRSFDQVKVITGRLNQSLKVSVSTKNYQNASEALPSGIEQLLVWDWTGKQKNVSIGFSGDTLSPVLGIALDSKTGIVMDNIPWRGSSGLTFTSISRSSLVNTYKMLDVRMVILQFGGNSVPYFKNEAGVDNYIKSFTRQIKHILSVDSTLKILVIGPGDMSFNDRGEMVSYPILESLTDKMRKSCNESGAAFWSMYHAMGGKNSMTKWVDEYPALAAPDYIHFTQKGSELIAQLFMESIEREYEIYRKKKVLNGRK